MTSSTIHGFPRIGLRCELKAATESHWAGEVSAAELQATARDLRRQVWEGLRDAGLGQIPSNHFSRDDHVLATYFAMARGRADAPAMEMTKWFDTNYHYIVPELGPDTAFRLEAEPKPLAELAEAAALGIRTRPVLLGPVTFLLLGKPAPDAPAGFEPLSLLDPLLDLYDELLGRVAAVVDGRNVWANDLERSLARLATLTGLAGEVVVSSSCSLQHVPLDLEAEPVLDPELRPWLAFARQKVGELTTLARGLTEGTGAIAAELAANRQALASRRRSTRVRAAADHHHRIVPADRRSPRRPGGAAPRRDRPARLRGADAGRDRQRRRAPGAPRPRRAGPRRAGAQRHGPVLRRAARRLRHHRAGLGAVLRDPLRAPADPLRRRAASTADHRGVDPLRPVAHQQAGQGHADRPGDHARLVVRARRPAGARHRDAGGAGTARRGRRPRGVRRGDRPGRRAGAARAPAAAARAPRRLPGLGAGQLPPGHRWRAGRDPDPHPHVLLAVRRGAADPGGAGRGRRLHRDRPLRHGPARRPPGSRVHAGGRARRVRHPLAACAAGGRDACPAGGRPGDARAGPAVGQPRLWPQDPRLRRGRGRAAQHG